MYGRKIRKDKIIFIYCRHVFKMKHIGVSLWREVLIFLVFGSFFSINVGVFAMTSEG